ncbi:oligosaccharide flippase family protein [Empedobacter sp.]|uniref:lipopolysaccharide biosynthesis protein n=1 Tax=Empedobacter sp. TaxID=1927715 RepID=UPI0028A9B40E|nr:oligosaccharide flippase family protein [Empedobacter sp.]
MSSQIKSGAIISYLAIAVNICIGFLYTPWMIQQIGKSDYGLYILVTAFLSYFLMDFGLGQTIARFLSNYRAKDELQKINQLLGLTSKFYLAINVIICIALVIVYFFLDNIFTELSSTEIEKFKVIYLIAGGFSLISFPFMSLDGVLIAYEKFVLLKLCDFISKVGIVILMIIALVLGYKLYALVAINAFVGLIILVIKLIYLAKNTSIKIDFKYKSKDLLRELIKFSFWISIIGIAQRLLLNIAPFILGVFSGTSEIAIFSIGIVIEGYVWTLAHALNGLFLPKLAKLNTEAENLKNISDLMIKVGRIQLSIIGLLLIGLIILGKQFIMLWMGKEFSQSYYVMVLLIAPSFIILTQEIAYTYLFVINELKYRAILFISATIGSVIISCLLAPKLGAIGCAIGIFSATMICHVIGMNYIYWKKIKLDIPRFFKECYSSFIIPIVLTMMIGIVLNYFYPKAELVSFVIKGFTLAFSYMVLVYSLGLNKNEKKMLLDFLKKIQNKINILRN